MKPKILRKDGSILLEVLLTIIILSVSVTLIMQAMLTSARASVTGLSYMRAAQAIDLKMVELLRKGPVKGAQYDEGRMAAPYADYTYRLETKPAVMDSGNNSTRLQEVNITASEKSGTRKNVVGVTSYILEENRLEEGS